MKKSIGIAFGLIPLVALALTVGGRYTWDRWLGSVPRLECPSTLDLGEHERGTIATAHFQIKNIGKGVLEANEFSTNCSCAGVERDIDGHFSRVNSIHLLPGEIK